VQSLASDIMLMSAVRLQRKLPSTQAFIVGTVHDSLLFQIRADQCERWVPVIRETMEDTAPIRKKFGADITVPILVEVKVGQHWGQGKVV
jgi:DNA polymerase I-like protein with 3'-5' exonuclease and polymerase domains